MIELPSLNFAVGETIDWMALEAIQALGGNGYICRSYAVAGNVYKG